MTHIARSNPDSRAFANRYAAWLLENWRMEVENDFPLHRSVTFLRQAVVERWPLDKRLRFGELCVAKLFESVGGLVFGLTWWHFWSAEEMTAAPASLAAIPDAQSPAPGPHHASIEEALAASDSSGTASILDVQRAGDEPESFEGGVAVPLTAETIEELFGVCQPTHEMVVQKLDAFQGCDRGQAIYLIVYRDNKPDEILFTGISYD